MGTTFVFFGISGHVGPTFDPIFELSLNIAIWVSMEPY